MTGADGDRDNGSRRRGTGSDDGINGYDVVSWEKRTLIDWVAYTIYNLGSTALRIALVVIGVAVLSLHVLLFGVGALISPTAAVFTVLSVAPAFVIAYFIWDADITEKEPFSLVLVTFMLGIAFAGLPSLVYLNVMPSEYFFILGYFEAMPVLSVAIFLFFVVAPLEEFVKWFAVRSYAYYSDEFVNAMDGAVYGAFAGLGFAAVENTLYLGNELLRTGSTLILLQETISRAVVGPLHVVFTSIAGYYLGLSITAESNRGPIIVKGLLIAVLLHGSYNMLAVYLPEAANIVGGAPISGDNLQRLIFGVFFTAFYGVSGYLLLQRVIHFKSSYPGE